MSITGRVISTVAATAFAVAMGAAAYAQQTKDQQGCINAVNKDAAKVGQAQGKENSGCVKTGTKGAVAPTCPTDDLKGKVAKKKAKTGADAMSKCGTAPDFAFTSAAGANTAFQNGQLDLLVDMFGNTDLSGVIVADKDTGGCQAAVAKDVGKIAAAASKGFVSCKKDALKGATVSAGDIAGCVGDDSKGKVGKAAAKLTSDIGKKCGAATQAMAFPGACSAAPDLGACLTAHAKCRVCLAANGADSLSANCDTVDDGMANSSCVATSCPLAAGRYATTQVSGGTLEVYGFPAFPFPAGGTIEQDVSAGSPPACVHDTVVRFPGGFSAPVFCVPALNLLTSVVQTGCGAGKLDSNGGSDFDTTEIADTSNPGAPCNQGAGASCVGGANTAVRVQVKVGDGSADTCAGTATANAIVTVPVHTHSWRDNSAGTGFSPCTGDGVQDGGDPTAADFDQILDFTTANATGSWQDLDTDGCAIASGSFGPAGGYTAAGTCVDLTKLNTAMAAVNTVAVGEFGSTGTGFDGSFKTVLPSMMSGPTAGSSSCGSPPLINYGGTVDRCLP